MGVDRSVSGGTSEVLAVLERDVLSVGRFVAFGETKIDNINSISGLLISSNQEVVRFDITMNNPFFMHSLDSLDHLSGDMENCLEIELSSALLEQVLKRLSEHVHHHYVIHLAILSFLITYEMEIWYSGFTSQFVDEFGLPEKHDMLLVLNSLLDFSCEEISGLFLLDLVDVSKGTSS